MPPEAELDDDAADAALGGDELVIDVQTHYVADRSLALWNRSLMPMYRALMPDWWTGMDGLVDYSLAEYLRCVFLESETALAVLTSAAGHARSPHAAQPRARGRARAVRPARRRADGC